jgi:hypothetical protein
MLLTAPLLLACTVHFGILSAQCGLGYKGNELFDVEWRDHTLHLKYIPQPGQLEALSSKLRGALRDFRTKR